METGNFLLRVAQSLLQNRIRNELLKRTVFPLQPYLTQAQTNLEQMISREWTTGVGGKGSIRSVELLSLAVLPEGLQVVARCTGNLTVWVEVKP
jgi:hypothetical protein